MNELTVKKAIKIKEVERLFCKKIESLNNKPDVKKKQYKRVVYRSYMRKKEES